MIYSSENDQEQDDSVKERSIKNLPDTKFPSSPCDEIKEVDDKVLHEDDEDIETGDKIDDAELDLSAPLTANDDEEVINVKDIGKDAAKEQTTN